MTAAGLGLVADAEHDVVADDRAVGVVVDANAVLGRTGDVKPVDDHVARAGDVEARFTRTVERRVLIVDALARIDQRERDTARESRAAEQKAAQEAARTAERQRIAAAESDLRTTLNAFSATTAGLKTFSAKVAALSALDPGNTLIDSSRNTAAQRIADAANETAKAGRYRISRATISS